MKAGGVATQILIAGATAVVTTTVAVLITSWLTRKSTAEDIASGKQPLPPGSKPTTTGPPETVKPVDSPQPQPPPPSPKPVNLISVASQLAQTMALPYQPCAPGYHPVPMEVDPYYWCVPDKS